MLLAICLMALTTGCKNKGQTADAEEEAPEPEETEPFDEGMVLITERYVKDGKMQSLSDHYSGSKLGSSLIVGDIEALTKDLKRVGLVSNEEALRILNMIGDFSMESNVDGEGSLVINLTDGSTNALKQIVDVSVDMMK